jgi:hypothetical protein
VFRQESGLTRRSSAKPKLAPRGVNNDSEESKTVKEIDEMPQVGSEAQIPTRTIPISLKSQVARTQNLKNNARAKFRA